LGLPECACPAGSTAGPATAGNGSVDDERNYNAILDGNPLSGVVLGNNTNIQIEFKGDPRPTFARVHLIAGATGGNWRIVVKRESVSNGMETLGEVTLNAGDPQRLTFSAPSLAVTNKVLLELSSLGGGSTSLIGVNELTIGRPCLTESDDP
jgi:hypothetical protein